MKHTNDKKSDSLSWRMRALTVAVIVGMTGTIAQADGTTERKKIGDLEIYKAAEGGKTTITMMLDTSGSMSISLLNNDTDYACDLPDGTSFIKGVEPRGIVPYDRYYCEVIGEKRYFYRNKTSPGNIRWYRCGDGEGSANATSSICDNEIPKPSAATLLQYTKESGTGNNDYYYKSSLGAVKAYDRLTRLKDAIFSLMDSPQLDSTKIAIGIGQFSSQSDSDNKKISADGSSGKIVVPASLLDPTQRSAIKTAVASFKGENGTPTANAYAEAGAYMLGKNTSTAAITTPREEYVKNNSENTYYKCRAWSGSACVSYSSGDNIYSSSGYTLSDCQIFGNKCLSKNKTQSANDWGFSGFAKSKTTSKSGTNYTSPLSSTNATCDGRGIYFLTDGQPNSSPTPLPLMRSALSDNSFSVPSVTLPVGSDQKTSGMPEVGAFAKALRDPAQNPLGVNILTAVVGFGSVFNVDRVADASKPETDRVIRSLPYTDRLGNETLREYYNCGKITDIDAKNACNWGAKSHEELPGIGGYGGGGFYSAQSTAEIVNSITTFVSDLDQTLPSAPSGTITIPSDPYRASNQLPYAYLPMLAPDLVSKSSIWKGNLKKYDLDQGTLFGKSNRLLYSSVAGSLNSTTQDLWQTSDYIIEDSVANNAIKAGGVYAQLRTPESDRSSVRTLYVEDYKSEDEKIPFLRKLSVNADGVPQGFGDLVDTDTYTQLNKRRLLSFLGFEGLLVQDIPTSDTPVEELILVAPTQEVKVLGGVVHSTPTAVSYSATLDENGRITDDRDDYILFGSMDGALHLVDSDNGEETFAIIPKYMLEQQPEALVEGSTKDVAGEPYFGVDAPWLVTTDYKYDLSTDPEKDGKVAVDNTGNKGMFAYGGLRMGGEAFYGMDITDKTSPEMLFTITADGRNDLKNARFNRLGQIWSKPTAAKIRWNRSQDPIDVLVFGGGYDMNYESDTYVPTADAPAKGNAIYMIDAKTGRLLWSTSGETGVPRNTKTDEMIHSITGEITVLDRDNDGLMDHLYAADLGGQVFRADFENARPAASGFTQIDNFSGKNVVRILDASADVDSEFAYRFYESPVVSFYRNEGTGVNSGKIFALVNVISGNRSAPLSRLRGNNDYANRVYGIIDNDVTNGDLYNAGVYNDDFDLSIEDLTEEENLVNLASTLGNTPSENQKNTAKAGMIAGTVNGWYYPLIRFDGSNNVKHNKGMGDNVVINSLLYTTVYNPDKQYGTTDSCAAKIVGGSERQLYCLPYGICMEDTSITGTGGFIPAGQGIQELALGAYNKDNTDLKVLIGTTPLTERIKADNRVGFDGGGDGSASEYIFNERYTIQPRAWYERSQ